MRERRKENLHVVKVKNLGARENAKAENQRLLQFVVNSPAKIKIPNVSIAKQETIANQIEQILELKNELVSNSREVLTKLNNLKESVLSKEFSYE